MPTVELSSGKGCLTDRMPQTCVIPRAFRLSSTQPTCPARQRRFPHQGKICRDRDFRYVRKTCSTAGSKTAVLVLAHCDSEICRSAEHDDRWIIYIVTFSGR